MNDQASSVDNRTAMARWPFFVWRGVFKGQKRIIYFCVNLQFLVAPLEKTAYLRIGTEMGFSDLVKPAGAYDNHIYDYVFFLMLNKGLESITCKYN